MTISRDPLGTYQKQTGAAIEKRRSASQTRTEKGRDVFDQLAALGQFAGFGNLVPNIPFLGGTALSFGSWAQMKAAGKNALRNLAYGVIFGALFRPETVKFVEDRYNQLLEERGFLQFQFFHAGRNPGQTLLIPFYENPTIQESRKPNYARSDIMGRNEPYRLWTGAQPRQVRLSFNMTLPHILQFSTIERIRAMATMENRIHTNDAGETVDAGADTRYGGADDNRYASEEEGRVMSDAVIDPYTHLVETTKSYSQAFMEDIQEQRKIIAAFNQAKQEVQPYLGAQDLIHKINPADYNFIKYVSYMVDTIRSSIIGSVTQANAAGPPIIYLKFGTLYNRHRFICTGYDIKFDGKAGYETKSLLPRLMSVTMTLESYDYPGGTSVDALGRFGAPGWDTNFIRTNAIEL